MLSRLKVAGPGLAAVLGALVWVPLAIPASAPGVLCTLAPGQTTLPAGTRHGLAHHLRQYPDLSLATARQRRAAERLLERARAVTLRWRNVRAAARSGFDTRLAKRAPGDDSLGWLHAEHGRSSSDRHDLDPKRPESLIYATEPGRRPVLVGVMFSVR